MHLNRFCQSCSMPLENEALLGTEKDGRKSHQYCAYCYQDGEFIQPEMTLEEMTSFIKMKMQELHIGDEYIVKAVNSLPYLNRWIAVKKISG